MYGSGAQQTESTKNANTARWHLTRKKGASNAACLRLEGRPEGACLK
ncbi:MAG: hypothetical protein IJN25_03110 [Clostridia bacterium]|nr:hypothetical protein [Clostridia bacterium]